MWTARLQIRHDDWLLEKTVKFNISATGIPLNSYKKDGKQYHTGMVFLRGEQKNKDRCIESLKKDSRIKKMKAMGNQVFVLIEGDDHITPYMPKELFFLKPVSFEKGYEYWEVGSWGKKTITRFYEDIKKIAEVKILTIKKSQPSIFIQHTVQKLTEKQKNAIESALEFGYYEYPRKISVEELAKKLRVKRTTFQEHLRKAESKVMKILLQG
jgi:predicted DNA binding protein